jgi:hypothetical protein
VATSTYLTNPTVNLAPTTGGAQVDLTDQCRSATITLGVDSLESTAFGDTGHRFVPGLQTVSVELEMYLSMALVRLRPHCLPTLAQALPS